MMGDRAVGEGLKCLQCKCNKHYVIQLGAKISARQTKKINKSQQKKTDNKGMPQQFGKSVHTVIRNSFERTNQQQSNQETPAHSHRKQVVIIR